MFEKIKQLLIECANVDEEKITKDAKLKDLGIDSLYAVEMILELETAFSIQIEYEEMEQTARCILFLMKRKKRKTKNQKQQENV